MPTYDYQCGACNAVFEVFGAAVGQAGADCPECGGRADRAFLPGSWTTHGSGILEDQYMHELGQRVGGYRGMERAARAARVRPIESRRYTKPSPAGRQVTERDIDRAYWSLTRGEVLAHREARERSEWEERNGVRRADEPVNAEKKITKDKDLQSST